MTYPEFLTELRKTPREWQLFRGYQIRSGAPLPQWGHCPITCLVPDKVGGAYQVMDAAALLSMSFDLAGKIVGAADMDTDYDEQIRKDLLDACGITDADEQEAEYDLALATKEG